MCWFEHAHVHLDVCCWDFLRTSDFEYLVDCLKRLVYSNYFILHRIVYMHRFAAACIRVHIWLRQQVATVTECLQR